jgi:hypothetical protein
MKKDQRSFFSIALSNEVVVTSLKTSLVVGTSLALINHGAAIIQGAFSQENYYQIALTYLVPYCVSTFSSTKSIQKHIS